MVENVYESTQRVTRINPSQFSPLDKWANFAESIKIYRTWQKDTNKIWYGYRKQNMIFIAQFVEGWSYVLSINFQYYSLILYLCFFVITIIVHFFRFQFVCNVWTYRKEEMAHAWRLPIPPEQRNKWRHTLALRNILPNSLPRTSFDPFH